MTHYRNLENISMKALALPIIISALAACATTAGNLPIETTSEYTAKRQADGSIELLITGTTLAPTRASEAKIDFGPLLENAASKECPGGYELTKDAAPSVLTRSGKLIATLRAVATCK